jgi:hypothetical protein
VKVKTVLSFLRDESTGGYEQKKRAQDDEIKGMIGDLNKDVKRLEKLEAVSKMYEKGGAVEKKLKENSRGHSRNMKREKEFGTHIGRFGHWL